MLRSSPNCKPEALLSSSGALASGKVSTTATFRYGTNVTSSHLKHLGCEDGDLGGKGHYRHYSLLFLDRLMAWVAAPIGHLSQTHAALTLVPLARPPPRDLPYHNGLPTDKESCAHPDLRSTGAIHMPVELQSGNAYGGGCYSRKKHEGIYRRCETIGHDW
ncbi:hypothetical protein BDU57DRAFT_306127 [Ampelomyces quisqualis]|uniref:Uncharacterized protein n=1 Tax=Ampelomyces quisqualis TaxID=50730 RepID=A0A6A5QHI7_AMPQU|nr:hypothetical protein BDU57DRAFT_306127 [Ampelomyces quisqualis]